MDETTTETTPAAPAEAPATAPTAAPDVSWAPEKFRVMGQDGALDLEATARKLAQGYSNAERLVGADRLPPETPDAYQFTLPEGMQEGDLPPDAFSPFKEKALKAGLTGAQFDFVMGEYFAALPALLNAGGKLTHEEARSELAQAWGSPTEVKANMAAVERAVSTAPPALQQQIKQRYATDPVFWQFAALFGKEVGEDQPPAPAGGGNAFRGSAEELMKTDAYRNPKHRDHAKVSEQVRRAFEQAYGGGPANG